MRRQSLITSLVAVAGLAVTSGAQAQAPPATTPLQKVSSEVQPGIVFSMTTFKYVVRDPDMKNFVGNGKVFEYSASCSGFFVNPDGYFASAGHCVHYDKATKDSLLAEAARWSFANEEWPETVTEDEAVAYALAEWRVRSPEDPTANGPLRTVRAAYPSGDPLPARVLGFRSFEGGDVALLKLEAENTPVLELAPTADMQVGSPIVSVGYPASVDAVADMTFDPSFKDGTVSSVKTVDGGLRKVFEISGAMSGGMSGGPTVDLEGRVVGVNSFGISGESQQFNFLSPASEVTALMKDKGVESRLGEHDELYRDGLAAYYAGKREAALAAFTALLDLAPDHEHAQEFRARSAKLPKAAPKAAPRADDSMPAGPLALGSVVLAALVLAGVKMRARLRAAAAAFGSAPAGTSSQDGGAARATTHARQTTTPPPAPEPADDPTLDMDGHDEAASTEKVLVAQ